jgi:hypothetical protein
MRGVVVKIENSTTIVMFNNGKIGRIPTPRGCKRGMVVTVSLNKKFIFLPVMGIVLLILLGGIFGFLMLARGNGPENFCRNPFIEKTIAIPTGRYDGYEALFAHIGKPLKEFDVDWPDDDDDDEDDNDDDDGDEDDDDADDDDDDDDEDDNDDDDGDEDDDDDADDDDDDDDSDEDLTLSGGHKNNRGTRVGVVRGFNYEHYSIVTYYDRVYSKVMVFKIIMKSKSVRFTGNFSIGDDRSLVEKYFNTYIKTNKKGVDFSYTDNDMRFSMENTILTFRFNDKNELTGVVIIHNEWE